MRKLLSLLLVVLVMLMHPSVSSALPVDVQKALLVATNFMKTNGEKNINLIDVTSATPFSEFYVFSGADGKGFVLVSADDCVKPILGYSATSHFMVKDMPAQVREWLSDYEEQIRFYKEHVVPEICSSIDGVIPVSQQWSRLLAGESIQTLLTSVSPLVTTAWDQTPIYNNLCPYDSYYGERTVTGCVATATAQIMKYWNHPSVGYGSHSYISDYGTLSANFGTTTYSWSQMPASLTSSSSTSQINAVATLMSHVGIALETSYDVAANGGSGAHTYINNEPNQWSAETILRYYFKYKGSLHHVLYGDFGDNQWSALLMNELDNNRPMLYSGRDESGGHCFICDGYNNSGMFHFNWGWSGWCDGYYAIGNLHPSSGGTGGNSSYTFNLDNAAVIGIEPNNSFGGNTTVTAVADNASCGSVTGGGSYTGTNTHVVTLTATAASGCRFTQWSDGYKYDVRRFYANGGNYHFTAHFEPLSGDTLGYASGDYLNSLGNTSTGNNYWGIKLPASTLTNGSDLTKVQLYVSEVGSYTLTVYTGSNSPSTAVHTQSFSTNASHVGHWCTLTLSSPVPVDGTQSLWITFNSSNASYPAAITYGCGNTDALLWGTSFSPITNRNNSFMIRGIFQPGSGPVVMGDTLSYCGNSSFYQSIGAGGSFTWGVKYPASMLGGHTQLTDVMLYVYGAGTYDMNIYQGTATNTSTRVAQKTVTYGSSAEETWQTIHLTSPVVFSGSQPIWITFSNNGVSYPASTCQYLGDTNSCLLTLDNGASWVSLSTATDGELSGAWMIRAILGNSGSCTVNTFPYTMGFESSDDMSCWTIIDNDNDGYSWEYGTQGADYAHSGSGFFMSSSYINNVGALTPDNWLITPKLQLSAGNNYLLTWYDGATDPDYYAEHYAAYVSTTGNSVNNFTTSTPVFQTTLTTAQYTQHTVNLSAYAGQEIYIAFRHYNSTDVFLLTLDDISITESAPQQHTVTVVSANPTMGSVTGGGTYTDGTTITISATPFAGYHFTQWNDGNTNATRSVTVVSNATYTAYFAADEVTQYTITCVPADQSMGTTTGSGVYPEGTVVTLTATPFAGYHFTQWNDGVVSNPRTITVTCDATYVANFAADHPEGIEEAAGTVSVVALPGYVISIKGMESRQIRVYDVMGRCYADMRCSDAEYTITMPCKGIYMVAIDNQPVQKIVLAR